MADVPATRKSSEIDKDGLTLQQRRLLQEIAVVGNWKEAGENLGMTARQVRTAFHQEAFKQKYDTLFTAEEIEITRRELAMTSGNIAEVLEAAKDAELMKKVRPTCPSCGTRFDFVVAVANWASRLKAVEILAKMTKLLNDDKNIKVEGTIANVHMGPDEFLALKRLQMGLPVPEHVYRRLLDIGSVNNMPIPPNPVNDSGYRNVIEGDYKEVPNEDRTTEGENE